ncbi:uncharacterized protein [Drosophila kikkawai]|uniref:Mitotic checkpoint serine/threonine-protein kinase BUB1 n=1 Tax=Drosophila kikkawai TaxID=30033 RepID=A0ABM3C689_DROKI|nr:uncharacterized protein LOC121502388 [Drosophila kikkawai]
MDFDTAKENIQPLASGRNVSLLQASLSLDSAQGQELVAQRSKLKKELENYTGEDPLDPWHAYICWIEQSYPAGGSESKLQVVLKDCLTKFEKDVRYQQDRRFIKLFIKFAQELKNPIELYQEMYSRGTGTMLADFYIAWAYCCDLSGNMQKADEIFRLGLQCRAQPLEELREAHQHFGYTVGQRMLYSDGEQADAVNQELHERRLALQSLKGRRQRGSNTITVGSVRTGAAVKSEFPGVVQMGGPSTSRMQNSDRNVEVFRDENGAMLSAVPQEVKTSHTSIVEAARGIENLKESMPWNKAHAKTHKHGKIFSGDSSPELGFDIHVDEYVFPPITNYERRFDKPFRFPPNFVAKNKPLETWVTQVTIEQEPEANAVPCYNKPLLYPRPNIELSPEEYRGYIYLRRHEPKHPLVLRNDPWWGTGGELRGIRLYPNFATASKPQALDELDKYFKPPKVPNIQVDFDQLYNDDEQTEYQQEELLAAKWRQKRNLTVIGDFDMDETACLPEDKMPRRKSFFPSSSRKSMMPRREDRAEVTEPAALGDDAPATSSDVLRQPAASSQPPVTTEQPKVHILEDPGSTGSTADVKFAVPDPPLRTIQIYQDPDEPESAPVTKAPVFDADETCSTQMFNMFIKSHGISTPKGPQKQAPSRQFGTVLKELSPTEEPASSPTSTEFPVDSHSPMLRKQLSTILETSEHGTQSSAATNATTKSTITSTSSSPGSRTTPTLAATPGPLRQQRLPGLDSSTVNEEQEKRAGHNFSRRELWEQNAPSVPMMKSLRFQEDKTETIPRALPCFQEDKTETLPRLPVGLPECAIAAGLLTPPKIPTLDDDDLCGLFAKTPPKMKTFGSSISQDASRRICERNTSEMFSKPPRSTRDSIGVSFVETIGKPSAAPDGCQLADSFMNELSFVPETQPVNEPGAPATQQKFEIFLDETQPEMIKPKPPMGCSFSLDCTVPETQQSVVHKEAAKKPETVGPSHMIASFMNDCTELSSCPPQLPLSSGTLKFASDSPSSSQSKSSGGHSDNFFELNAATEMFATNISMIKNSTLLPPSVVSNPPADKAGGEDERDDNGDLSIYYKSTPLTPKQSHRSWCHSDNDNDSDTLPRDHFVHPKLNTDKTVVIQTVPDNNINPFNIDLIGSLLDEIDFSQYIEKLPHCQLVGHVKRLRPNAQVEVNGEQFEVVKMLDKGSYGTIYTGKHVKTGKKVALKQERPANYWEFYITLEVHSRLSSEQMFSAYTHFDYALVGNNCSVYISDFSDYGSLISVCNKIKSGTGKNLDEYVVMHLSCQMLDIVDHLHALGIIHADIKADNFLLMKPLCAHPNEVSLQLIDFGVSIDTRRFPPNQTFNYVHHHELFKCIEMRTNRPWTYQLDLFGLVGVMHVLLFGSYMEVVKRSTSGVWMPKTALPRYVQRQMWETIFRTLLNIRDCRTMPNLQELRMLLKSELAEKEKYVAEAISKFNMILHKE